MDQLDALRGVVSSYSILCAVEIQSVVILLVLMRFFFFQDSLQVVLHRFSDGVEVVKCVLEFCKVGHVVTQIQGNPSQSGVNEMSFDAAYTDMLETLSCCT